MLPLRWTKMIILVWEPAAKHSNGTSNVIETYNLQLYAISTRRRSSYAPQFIWRKYFTTPMYADIYMEMGRCVVEGETLCMHLVHASVVSCDASWRSGSPRVIRVQSFHRQWLWRQLTTKDHWTRCLSAEAIDFQFAAKTVHKLFEVAVDAGRIPRDDETASACPWRSVNPAGVERPDGTFWDGPSLELRSWRSWLMHDSSTPTDDELLSQTW